MLPVSPESSRGGPPKADTPYSSLRTGTANKGFSPASPRRKRRSGGSALIESAFTLLPVFAFIFAFVDFGLALFRWSTLQNAVREGCRYAITFQTASASTGQDASIKQVVERYAFSFVTANDTPPHIFVNYYSPSDLNTPIASGGNFPGNVVEVSVQNISWAWLAPISGSLQFGPPALRTTAPITFTVSSADILGGYPAGQTSVNR